MKVASTLPFIWCLSVFTIQAQDGTGTGQLQQGIQNLRSDSALNHASWGICIKSLSTGKILAEYNSSQSLIPASTLKISTTAAALGILGENHQYETKLEYDGLIDSSGILHGNIYIRGGGDPTLESEFFRSKKDSAGIMTQWTNDIRRSGIKSIEGNIIGDAGIFDDELAPPSWIWGDIGNYYGSGASGLSYRDNAYSLYFSSGEEEKDSTQIVRIDPQVPGLSIQNNVFSGGNQDNAFIYGGPYSYYRYVSGTIPSGKKNFEVNGSIPDPPLFCAQSLKQSLEQAGIRIQGEANTIRELRNTKRYTETKRQAISTHLSPPLHKIVYWTNLKSNNLYAEHLLKSIAASKNGLGSDSSGIHFVYDYWKSKHLPVKGFYMEDGAGLSRANTITTRQQVDMLEIISKEPYFKSFYSSLPIAARTGSLSSMFKGTAAENNLRAKSGYINRVRAYAGYVKNKKGEELAFSIILNNYECSAQEARKKIEKVLVLLAESE